MGPLAPGTEQRSSILSGSLGGGEERRWSVGHYELKSKASIFVLMRVEIRCEIHFEVEGNFRRHEAKTCKNRLLFFRCKSVSIW